MAVRSNSGLTSARRGDRDPPVHPGGLFLSGPRTAKKLEPPTHTLGRGDDPNADGKRPAGGMFLLKRPRLLGHAGAAFLPVGPGG